MLTIVWNQRAEVLTEKYRQSLLAYFVGYRRGDSDTHQLLSNVNGALRSLKNANDIHRNLLGLSESEYRLRIIGE